MLKPKIAKEILKVCKSKDEVTQMFLKKYGCKKAIRLIKRDYMRTKDSDGRLHSDCKLTYACDNCGELFVKMESDKSKIHCPKCGYRTKVYNYWHQDSYVDETYNNYSFILSTDNKIVEPCAVLHEIVNYDGADYHVMRRFHFLLKNGQINDIYMAKCIVAGLLKKNGARLLYESNEGCLRTANKCYSKSWFTNYKYHEIPCENYFGDMDSDEKEKILDEVSNAYYDAIHYYEPDIVMAREMLERFPVRDESLCIENGSDIEINDRYFIYRVFHSGKETYRWIYSYEENINCTVEYNGGEWSVLEKEYVFWYDNDIFILHRNKLMGSFLEKIGLFNVINFRDDIFDENSNSRDGVEYLFSINKYPIIESLAKVGLKDLIKGICSNRINVDESKSKLWQRLCLSKANYDLMFSLETTSDDCNKLQVLNKLDKKIDAESFIKYRESNYAARTELIINVMTALGLNFKQVIDYLSDVEENQGYFPDESIVTWNDYIGMFKDFYGYYPKKREDKYPDSLKKAHDLISMYIMRHRKDSENESFDSVNKKWKRLSYSDGRFCITLPSSSSDLDLESKELGHCVHSYSKYVKNGECVILFLRKANEPDKSFFTMEFDCHDKLVQIRGKTNRRIEDINDKHKKLREDLISFLRKWGRLKHIKTGYEDSSVKAA